MLKNKWFSGRYGIHLFPWDWTHWTHDFVAASAMFFCLSLQNTEIIETKCFCFHVLHSMVDVNDIRRDEVKALKEIFLLLMQSSEPEASVIQNSSPPPHMHSSSAPPNIPESSLLPITLSSSAPPSILNSSPPSSSCSSSVSLDHSSSIPLTDRCVQNSALSQQHHDVNVEMQVQCFSYRFLISV